ncbi:DNA-binding transcriptional regulator CytR [Escherichia coli]|nr:substrate-binding domain-containing protein [Escherichia coli]SPX07134.1 DNA-binding transcriptional regulator CytR [Escherichia coli]
MKAKKQETAATMKDVALKAKVSTATVSRALMNPDKVSQATRNRVEKAAREVGYLPQPMGRNVKRNESRTILVIVPDICDPFFSEIIRGIEVTAANHGYLVLIGDCAHQNQQEKTFIDLIITKQIDGMLLLGSRLPFDASIEEQRNLPPMVMALGALSQAKRQGLKVPEDLSIIGFDNIDLTQFCDPPLTTIAQPRYEIGREAMLLLLDQMQGQHVGSGSRLMDCELIIRGSTRALP